MKKDIKIPEVNNVYLAAVNEPIPETEVTEWSVYVINDGLENLELVIVVSDGFSKSKKTSTLRKKLNNLPKKSFAKIEILQDDLFEFTNQFKVSFFKDNQLHDKTFTFKPNSINKNSLEKIPLLQHTGVLAE